MSNKKETTLEDAAEKLARAFDNDNYKALMDLVIDGAEWQAERMYSEKELLEFGKLVLDTFHSEGKTKSGKDRLARIKYDNWFEQFKKQNNEQ
jgi:hypothetical protein